MQVENTVSILWRLRDILKEFFCRASCENLNPHLKCYVIAWISTCEVLQNHMVSHDFACGRLCDHLRKSTWNLSAAQLRSLVKNFRPLSRRWIAQLERFEPYLHITQGAFRVTFRVTSTTHDCVCEWQRYSCCIHLFLVLRPSPIEILS